MTEQENKEEQPKKKGRLIKVEIKEDPIPIEENLA